MNFFDIKKDNPHSIKSFLIAFLIGATISVFLSALYFISKMNISDFTSGQTPSALQMQSSDLINIQIISMVSLFFISALIYAKLRAINFYTTYHLLQKPRIQFLILGVAFAISAFPFLVFTENMSHLIPLPQNILEWAKNQDLNNEALFKKFFEINSVLSFFKTFLVISIFAGICEELFFRGALQNVLLKYFKNPHIAIWIQGIAFGVFHFNLYQMIPIALIGICFGYIYFYSKNIWYTIIIHALYNGIQVVLYYLYINNVLGFNIDNTSDVLWWQGLLSFLIASSLFYLLLQLLNKKS